MGNLDLRVQHAQDVEELRVLDNDIWTVAVGAPHRELEAKAGLRIGGPECELFNARALGCELTNALLFVALEIGCRVVPANAKDGWLRSSNKK